MSHRKFKHATNGAHAFSNMSNLRKGSKFQSADELLIEVETSSFVVNKLDLQPMSDLDLMIANGWGSTPQNQIPPDWRTRRKC